MGIAYATEAVRESVGYPAVAGETITLDLVLAGHSLARYGDGEFRLARGSGNLLCQRASQRLRDRLRAILLESGDCLVGIPNIRSPNRKARLWDRYRHCAGLLADRPYVSSFISRPDSADWIDRPEYWDAVDSLWAGKDVTLVCGDNERSLGPLDLASANSVRQVICPITDAFAEYDAILKRIGTPDLAILCLGPTATLLAVDLCARGVHAVDLGHIGFFLRRHRLGQSMFPTTSRTWPF